MIIYFLSLFIQGEEEGERERQRNGKVWNTHDGEDGIYIITDLRRSVHEIYAKEI